jgi:hypothetical protein
MADIHHAILIAASPEKIYPLVATARGFGEWWAEDITESAGKVELGFFKRATIYRLSLITGQPPTHADWMCETGDQWNQTHISFTLEARGAQTFLSFAHSGWPSETEYFTSCNTTWGELMFRLKSAAEGKSKGPLFRATELAY